MGNKAARTVCAIGQGVGLLVVYLTKARARLFTLQKGSTPGQKRLLHVCGGGYEQLRGGRSWTVCTTHSQEEKGVGGARLQRDPGAAPAQVVLRSAVRA